MRGDTGRLASALRSVGKAPIPALGLESLPSKRMDLALLLAPLVTTRAFSFWVKPEALNAEASLEIPGLFNAKLGRTVGRSIEVRLIVRAVAEVTSWDLITKPSAQSPEIIRHNPSSPHTRATCPLTRSSQIGISRGLAESGANRGVLSNIDRAISVTLPQVLPQSFGARRGTNTIAPGMGSRSST